MITEEDIKAITESEYPEQDNGHRLIHLSLNSTIRFQREAFELGVKWAMETLLVKGAQQWKDNHS